ncbi:MAG: YebC/PmpR family DNA-binding transcriptional regulator [Gammaproteobacteria bacterium]|nr:YebC/PmpR family DNA-binding transcriptional regulator [Gammaproteobacteria bacterium]
MAGHSKWANIQHRKNAQDSKRGKLFTKLIREITTAARLGGGDAATNPRLRLVMDKALTANMTRDTIERAIKRGSGAMDADNFEEIRYEGYAPGGVAVMVDCMTDNRQRTVSDVRHALTKCGGNLGTDGSVAYLFLQQGVISFAPGISEDKIMEIALDAGADDIQSHDDGSIDVLTTRDRFIDVKETLLKAGLIAVHAEVTMRATLDVVASGDDAAKIIKLIDMLEDLDDVQEVYTNADIADDAWAAVG